MSGVEILFLLCPPRVAKTLMEELMDKLAEQRTTAKVIKYGIMNNGCNGFIIIAAQGLPTDIIDNFKQDEEVEGYVLVTSDDLNANNNSPATGKEAQQ